MDITIENKDKLRNIFKTISWLDDKRWEVKANYNFINFSREDLTNCEKVLTHWICYITDRQKKFEAVWDEGGYVFSGLLYEYSRCKNKNVDEILKKYYINEEREGKTHYKFQSNDGKKTFASRYVTDDYQNIKQTLEILNDLYDRNITEFIRKFIDRFKDADDLMIRIASGLYLLTYKLDQKKANSKKIENILINDDYFEKEYMVFKKNTTKGKKRIWCSIRDYKKGLYHVIFQEAIREVTKDNNYINKWNELSMNQIELPGDVWNNRPVFRDNLFANIIEVKNLKKSEGLPDIIRELYNKIDSSKNLEGFYPEQFDITFDFVPRMCEKKLCEICLFGSDGVELICIPSKDKYCPVALISCGYISECKENNCIIKEGISKGICREIQNENYK